MFERPNLLKITKSLSDTSKWMRDRKNSEFIIPYFMRRCQLSFDEAKEILPYILLSGEVCSFILFNIFNNLNVYKFTDELFLEYDVQEFKGINFDYSSKYDRVFFEEFASILKGMTVPEMKQFIEGSNFSVAEYMNLKKINIEWPKIIMKGTKFRKEFTVDMFLNDNLREPFRSEINEVVKEIISIHRISR